MARSLAAPAVLIMVLTLLSGGCTAPGHGYVSESVGRLTVDRPAGWDLETTVESPWHKGFRDAADAPEQLQLSGDFGAYASAGQAMGTLIGKAQVGLPSFRVIESREITVTGATTAQLTRYTVADGRDGELSGLWIVAAHWPYPQSVAVSVLAAERDPALEQRLITSMRLRADRR
ncbi:hypothetical protein [Microlunatus parietis]|uniref:Polyketide cyclase / dehydrase and lipid transport n=1 Tax=Microlunatus parietis TaxID=682979 RepID=A0A7Y9IDG1_9ACTN|nr:hypothetical protein [Microlunatus parietis]NYE74898.1 hypothetical protein [Microlunatus parietis]